MGMKNKLGQIFLVAVLAASCTGSAMASEGMIQDAISINSQNSDFVVQNTYSVLDTVNANADTLPVYNPANIFTTPDNTTFYKENTISDGSGNQYIPVYPGDRLLFPIEPIRPLPPGDIIIEPIEPFPPVRPWPPIGGFKPIEIKPIKGEPIVLDKPIMTPIFKFSHGYQYENGMCLLFAQATGTYKDYNPSVLASPIAAQIGGYLTQLNSYDEAFANMDMTMLMTKKERAAMKYRNKTALVDSTNLGMFSPNQIPEANQGTWFRPYANFEKVSLRNGPKVSNVGYGTFVGGDTEIIELKNGWDAVYSAYVGYNGSHQAYDGVGIYQNGGHLGATGVFYKENFFTGVTVNAGASVATANAMYGHEDFTMFQTGIASKTGYNWELAEGKFIVQPSWLMSYSFINTFDYHNAGGVKIGADPLHAIQLMPGIKFIGNLKHNWQPYVGVQMVWNILDDTKFHADEYKLPEMSVKPYIQYGVGVQKRWGERFTGFFQTMFRNGGRTGVALSAGFRWSIGK